MQPIYLFSVRRIPVFVSVWYFLLLAYWTSQSRTLESGLIFAVCVTFSLLVHEFGHATFAARYRLNPRVMLHGWGGMCMHDRASKDSHDALIVAAGPGAGLVLGGLVWAAEALVLATNPTLLTSRPVLWEIMSTLVFINIGWSLLNLLPLHPLDGGQLFRLGLVRLLKPRLAHTITHTVGLALAGIAMVLSWVFLQSLFLVLITGFLAYANFKQLRLRSTGPVRPVNRESKKLLDVAFAKLDAGNYREAARLGHQARAERHISDKQLARAWHVISVATISQGKYEEGLRFAKRAPALPSVAAARAEALIALGRLSDAQAVVNEPAFRRLPSAQQRDLRARMLVPEDGGLAVANERGHLSSSDPPKNDV